jgi:ATP-binding cassette, subfamily A (ABC1), member 3
VSLFQPDLGTVYGRLLFPLSSVAVSLFWHILAGWALTSASVFAAAFLTKPQLSGAYVVVGFLVVALGGSILDAPRTIGVAPSTATSSILSLLFPSFNYMFIIGYYARYEILGIPIDLLRAPPSTSEQPVASQLPALAMWMFLVVQIIVHPILAVVVERILHGVSFESRTFDTSQEASNSAVALYTSTLSKTYVTPWYKRLVGAGHSGDVDALQGLELACQRGQILCLLGANGSGKTTTLDLISGVQAPTVGNVTINASASQLGLLAAPPVPCHCN